MVLKYDPMFSGYIDKKFQALIIIEFLYIIKCKNNFSLYKN